MGEYKDQSKLDIAILPHFYCNEQLGDNTERCSECKWAPNAHLQCLCGHGGRGARLRSDEKAARCTREREHGESDARSPLFARARRRRRDSVGEHRSAGSGPAPSRRPIYLRHSQSPLSVCLPPSAFNSLLSTAAGQGTCRTCLISSKETRTTKHVREGGRNRRTRASPVVTGNGSVGKSTTFYLQRCSEARSSFRPSFNGRYTRRVYVEFVKSLFLENGSRATNRRLKI